VAGAAFHEQKNHVLRTRLVVRDLRRHWIQRARRSKKRLLSQSGQSYSAMAGGMALSVLMLPTIIKTTDEGLKLVPQELRWGAIGVGASKFVTITSITLPTAMKPIATGIVLSIARAAGETAPLIFTALFSPFWPEGLFSPIASMSVLIYNFAIMPYDVQIALAWATSFVLVMMILIMNIFARYLGSLNRN
jgi:phosphate transport system permease protein